MKDTPLSQNPEAIKQREWRWKMTPEKRAAFLAKRRARFASIGVHEQRERRANDPGKSARYAKAEYQKNPARWRAVQKEYRAKVKIEVFNAYGRTCACCGEDELAFLTIDHIIPIMRQQRTRAGSAFYYVLKRDGFPSGYQVLCFNCNAAKRINPVCPHKAHYLKLLTGPDPCSGGTA